MICERYVVHKVAFHILFSSRIRKRYSYELHYLCILSQNMFPLWVAKQSLHLIFVVFHALDLQFDLAFYLYKFQLFFCLVAILMIFELRFVFLNHLNSSSIVSRYFDYGILGLCLLYFCLLDLPLDQFNASELVTDVKSSFYLIYLN